jgi:serine/threonine protein kinase
MLEVGRSVGITIYNAGEDTAYRLLREIRSGQEGQTWEAEQLGAGSPVLPVAVKILRPNTWLGEPVDPLEILRKWRGQALLMRSFTHRGFAAVQVAFSTAAVPGEGDATPASMVGLPAFVMAWIEGVPLDAWSKGVADPLARLLVLEQAADGLDAFHRETGHVHCDLKPANVMVDTAGETRIVDFGLIRTADRLGTHSILAGSEPYMDPLLSQHREYSAATDIYAFAGLMYFQLLRDHPVRGRASPETHRVLTEAGFERAATVLAYALSPALRLRPGVSGAADLLDRVIEQLQPRCARPADRDAPSPSAPDASTVPHFGAHPPAPVAAFKPVVSRSVALRIASLALTATIVTVIVVLVIRSLHS